jgi:cation transport regulator
MPYMTIDDLPRDQVDQYSEHQREIFLAAFNSAVEEYDHDESKAFAVAHAAAKRAGVRASGASRSSSKSASKRSTSKAAMKPAEAMTAQASKR